MKMCNFKNCGKTENLSEVVVTFKDAENAPEDHRVEAIIQDLLVCPDHAHSQPESFVTDDGWNKIVAEMRGAGFAAPARSTVKIVFRPTDESQILSENDPIAREWDTPEEDEAWADL